MIGSRYRRKDRDGNLAIVLNKDYKKSVNHHFKDQGSNMVKKSRKNILFFYMKVYENVQRMKSSIVLKIEMKILFNNCINKNYKKFMNLFEGIIISKIKD